MPIPGYTDLKPYWGDIHNHCDISYGDGSMDEALTNARLQLDFASVTAHAHWPDLPPGEAHLAHVHAYHRAGFDRAMEQWPAYQALTNNANVDGEFVTFQSFEWHSLRYGDHNVYFSGDVGDIIPASDLDALRTSLRDYRRMGVSTFLIPHHIGYRTGYRGIDWDAFTPEFSPFVEMFSMHGCAEGDDAPYPYLHTMGPRDSGSTMQAGLAAGHVFGVAASTDSHSAHPGSHGHGRIGVWARELTREGIWDAFRSRRTWAATGDRIDLAFAVDGQPMGSIVRGDGEREITFAVVAGDAIDYAEVVHNNRVIERWDVAGADGNDATAFKVHLEVGWGELDEPVDWQVELRVSGGRVVDVEPRFRGWDIISPQSETADQFAFSRFNQDSDGHIRFSTRSFRNPTTVTPATQGVCLTIEGDDDTRIGGTINDQPVDVGLRELRAGARAGYLGGFLTPAWLFHRAAPNSELTLARMLRHRGATASDWYYLRVRQRNNQWAWSSPIWVRNS